jgi:hypothetical protein
MSTHAIFEMSLICLMPVFLTPKHLQQLEYWSFWARPIAGQAQNALVYSLVPPRLE